MQLDRVRRNPWVMGLAALPFLLVPVGLIGALFAGPAIFAALYGTLLGCGLTTLAWRTNPWPRFRPVEVEVDDSNLVVDGAVTPRSEIGAAHVQPRLDGSRVRLERPWNRPDIELRAGEATARELVARLGLSAEQTAATFRGASPLRGRLGYQIAIGVGLFLFVMMTGALAAVLGAKLAPLIVLPTILLALAAQLVPSTITVGTDGVNVCWLWRERFIPHSEIESVRTGMVGIGNSRTRTVDIVLESGEEVVVPVGSPRWEGRRTDELRARIEQAHAAYQRGDANEDTSALARHGRDPAEWVAGLRAALEVGQHRAAAILPERLWPIVEDPKRPAWQRAAAAVVLGSKLTSVERKRIEATAATVASPKLRIALEGVTAGDVEALAESLAELEAEQRAQGR